MSDLIHGLSGRLLVIAGLLALIVIVVLLVPTWLELITGVKVIEEPEALVFNTAIPTIDPNSYTATTIPSSSTPTISIIREPALGIVGNCTAALDYWVSHPDKWNFELINIADFTYSTEDITAVFAGDPQDVRTFLLQQMLVYSMNAMRGADPGAVIDISNQARAWLSEHADDLQVFNSQSENGLSLARKLEEYNSGLIGPGLCPQITDTPVPTATNTLVPSYTPTSTPSMTLTVTPASAILTDVAFPGVTREQPEKPQPPPATVQPTQPPPEPTEPPPTESPPEPTEPPPPEPPTPVPTREEPPTPAPTPAP